MTLSLSLSLSLSGEQQVRGRWGEAYLGVPKLREVLDAVKDGALVRQGRVEIVLLAWLGLGLGLELGLGLGLGLRARVRG